MPRTKKKNNPLAALPGVDKVLAALEKQGALERAPRGLATICARQAVDELREKLLSAGSGPGDLLEEAANLALKALVRAMRPNLRAVINGTGVVVHTNLGRSLLPPAALDHALCAAGQYTNLEFDLSTGKRGSRYSIVESLIRELTGAESALVVNNNAGAVFLCLNTLSRGREAIVSRGELVEIGGSFRIPEVMESSGAILREVGATNRTHPADYENAIGPETALLLKAHTSNFTVVGFTSSVPLSQLCPMAEKHGIKVMEDLGSGSLLDLSAYGLAREPTVQEAVASGADVVTFSGDKMLGGPQAGIIVGKKASLDLIKKNPVNRALRIDKLTLAALEAVLRLYRDPEKAIREIPTLSMLCMAPGNLYRKAGRLAKMLRAIPDKRLQVERLRLSGRVGGGSLPLQELEGAGVAVAVQGISPNSLENRLRLSDPPIIGRIEQDRYLLDARTLLDKDLADIAGAVRRILTEEPD